MVGLPNRVARCSICQRHKIKCDLLRPACTRCKRLGLKCEYPNSQQGQIFINRSVTHPHVKAVDMLSNPETKKVPKSKGNPGAKQVKSINERYNQIQNTSIPKPPSSDIVDRMQLLSTFVGLYLPRTVQSPTVPGQSPATWVHQLPDLDATNEAYNLSIKALCISQIGIWNRDLPLGKESQRLYGSALGELRKAISSPKLVAPEAILATIIILSTYELFSGSSDRSKGWMTHARGGSRILQLLGPNVQMSPVGRQCCLRIRTIGIFESFRTRKTSLLAGLNLNGSEGPDLYCRLQDIMTQVPSILEAFDLHTLRGNKSTDSSLRIRVLPKCATLVAQLQAWCEDLREQVHGRLYWSTPSVAHNPADLIYGRIFPLAFHFPNLSVAQLLLLYWSTLVVLYRTIQDIYKRLGDNETYDLDFDHNCTSNDHIAAPAKKICQSMEYCYKNDNGTLGVQSTVFTRWVVEDFYASQPNYQQELAWCLEIDNMTAPDSRFDLQVMKLGSC